MFKSSWPQFFYLVCSGAMDSVTDWTDIFLLLTSRHRAAYLKAISLALNLEIKTIAEIGVFRGANAKRLRLLFPDAHLYLIDPWRLYDDYCSPEAAAMPGNEKDYEEAYSFVVQEFKNDPKVTILRKSSAEAAGIVPDNLDVVFIDGNHAYPFVKQDIELWLPKVKSKGLCAGHDFDLKGFPGVVKAVKEAFRERIHIGIDRVWLHIKD
jgi:hypothetical protein